MSPFFLLILKSSVSLGALFLVVCSIYHQRRRWHPTPILLLGKSHGQRSLVSCSPWGRTESDTTERLHFHALEKEMDTHSSVLAWRFPRTGEPGGLPSMGSHRVGHNWSDLAAAAAFTTSCDLLKKLKDVRWEKNEWMNEIKIEGLGKEGWKGNTEKNWCLRQIDLWEQIKINSLLLNE